MLFIRCLLFLVVAAGLVGATPAAASSLDARSPITTLGFDAPSTSTTPTANTHVDAPRGNPGPEQGARSRPSRFAQSVATKAVPEFSQATASETFAHGSFAGRTIGDVATGLRSGSINPSALPVEVLRRGGETLALNTRSTLALRRGGVDPADWAIRDVTGNAVAERILTRRLARNGMTGGSDVIRITGAGRHASSTR